MNNPILKAAMVLIFLSVLSGSCGKKDMESPDSPPSNNQSSATLSIGLSGRVLDENQVPVNGAMVRSGMQTTVTDIDGRFQFNNLQVSPGQALVEVKKQGFFNHTQSIETGYSNSHYADIVLKGFDGDHYLNPASGAILNDGNGASISFEPNSLVDKLTNSVYSGQVLVHFRWIDPTKQQDNSSLPFSVLGSDNSKERFALNPYSSLLLEISGNTGNTLALLPGKTITISLPIAEDLIASAPNSIPLWQHDPASGLWKKKGLAQKTGNSFTATINEPASTSFSVPFPISTVTGTIMNQQGSAFAMGRFLVRSTQNKSITLWEGRTDESGKIFAKLPANENMVMELINDCGERIGTQNIRTSSSTMNLPAIKVAFEGNRTFSLSGKVTNCKQSEVTNGWVDILMEGKTYRASITNGRYYIAVNRCSPIPVKALVVATNKDGNLKSEGLSIVIKPGNNDLPDLSTCMSAGPQYVNYAISTNSFMNYSPEDSISTIRSSFKNITQIYSASNRDDFQRKLSFQFESPAKPGQYGITGLEISHQNIKYVQVGKALVTITSFGAIGEEIEGKITGNAKRLDNGQSFPFSIEFKVIRKN